MKSLPELRYVVFLALLVLLFYMFVHTTSEAAVADRWNDAASIRQRHQRRSVEYEYHGCAGRTGEQRWGYHDLMFGEVKLI